ncbi:MAG TPA: carboxymuconolactone decarboxylase family protein [Acidobacteriota bacterium]
MKKSKAKPDPSLPELLEPPLRKIYERFERESYRASGIPAKFKELIAMAAALVSGGQKTLELHIQRSIRAGASRQEISETIAIAAGISAATLVERADAAENQSE